MNIERVSRWFATGFSQAQKGLPKAKLNDVPVENAWQKNELVTGYDAFKGTKSHIQFWLVEGEFDHASVEKKIAEEFDKTNQK